MGGWTLLVCRECGVQHLIAWALESRGEDQITEYEVIIESLSVESRRIAVRELRKEGLNLPDALEKSRQLPFPLGGNLPRHRADELSREIVDSGGLARLEVASVVDNPAFGPLVGDRIQFVARPARGTDSKTWIDGRQKVDRNDLAQLHCESCQAKDALKDSEPLEQCPACRSNLVTIVAWWVT